jgi:hypothetical protein
MPVKRLKYKTMKKSKKTKTKKARTKKNTRKQKQKNKKIKSKSKSKSIINSTFVHSNMDSMYNNSSMNSIINSRNIQPQTHHMNQQNLFNLITKISQERQNKTKSQTNLPARLMRIPSSMSKMSQPKTYAKSVSSYYSTMTHNGESHNKGKKIVNESTKPYLEIDEMRDGQIHHYMLPKNSIPYTEPIQEVLPIQDPKIVLEYYPHSRQNKKHKKKPRTNKK